MRAGLGGCTKKEHLLVGGVTTLCWHMASVHKVRVLSRMFEYMLTNYMDILEYLLQIGEDCPLRLNASRRYGSTPRKNDRGECTPVPCQWTLQGRNPQRQTPALLWWNPQWSREKMAHWNQPGIFLLINPWFRTYNIINQLLQALKHPSFRKMVSIAACATRGSKLDSRKQTQNAIMKKFKEKMRGLKERLNICFKHYLAHLDC